MLVSELEVWKQTSTLTSPPIPNISKDVSVVPELVSPAKVAETKPATGRGIRHALLAAVCAMAILFVGQFDAMFGRSNLTSVRVESETLLGLDAKARVLWRNPVPGVDASRYLDGERHLWVGALSGDEPAVLFVPIPTGVTQESVPLICLDKHGRELWKFNPGKSVRGRNSFTPPFIVRQFVVVGGKIVVTSHHHKYSPSQIAVLDSKGKLLREYWHPGNLNILVAGSLRAKPVVFLGGLNNVRGLATAVVLDPERLEGSASENGQPHFAGMAPGVEEARIFFPRSGLDPDAPYNAVVQILPRAQGTLVSVHERVTGTDRPSVDYHFSPDLQLTKVVFSDVFVTEFARHFKRPFSAMDEAALRRSLVLVTQ